MAKERLQQLALWREEAVREVEAVQSELAGLQQRADEAKARFSLLDKLLALEAGDDAVPPGKAPMDLLDACEDILQDAGSPQHISQIHAELLARGVPLPGKGNEANIIARLQRSDGRFVRTGRGTYALAGSGFPEEKPVRRRKRAPRK